MHLYACVNIIVVGAYQKMEERDKPSESFLRESSSWSEPPTKWQKLEEELNCCFCDELLSDPITIPEYSMFT